MYQIGTPTHLTVSFTDSNGDPIAPATVTVEITRPDGTSSSLAAVGGSLGDYTYDYTPTVAGLHSYYFKGVGANAANSPVDTFTVDPLTSGALVSLAEAKNHLHKSGTSDDAAILGFIQAATGIINRRCGYSAPTIFTETVDGRVDASGTRVLVLARTPVLSVTSITPQLTGLPTNDLTALVINTEAGTVYLSNWFEFYGPATVVYTAGRTTVPEELKAACLLMVQWFWESRRGGSTVTPNQGGDDTTVVDGLELPSRAVALMNLSPYTAAPGIA